MASTGAIGTGLPELDRLLRGLIPGDNVVWRVNDIEDYAAFVQPYVEQGLASGNQVIYFRFSSHEPLLAEDARVQRHDLDPAMGFESFLSSLHGVIEAAPRRAYYVFDCLSDLAVAWFTDQTLCNFFRLTCPYLYDRSDLAYFALLRSSHPPEATMPIQNTAQIFADVYRHKDKLYIRPLKAQQRYSPTMHMLHVWDNHTLEPVTASHIIAEILAPASSACLGCGPSELDTWGRTFTEAQEASLSGDEETYRTAFDRLLHMVVSRDDRVLELVRRYFTLDDVIAIGRRTVGTGLIGGKSIGMLLARAILAKTDPRWNELLETHDSFYVASDVFYSFLVSNGCWWARQQQNDPDLFLSGAEQVRRRIITGAFPEQIEDQFARMLEYFGQSPVIVRSSSLLEDNFGNSFAGKYESVFCANQGSPRQRLEDFKSAVKFVYASAMSEAALAYRKRHGLLQYDEQMALLVQRVSGARNGDFFYPHAAGVGFSFNPFVWDKDIDPEAGLIRLVFGLGTRAVDRSDDDYTRIVALNAPDRRPEGAREDIRRYCQRKIDVLDLDANQLIAADFDDVYPQITSVPIRLFATPDNEAVRHARAHGQRITPPMILNFDRLLAETSFVPDMRDLLRTIEDAYQYPVDIEFTVNFLNESDYRIDVVQCRPLQVKGRSVALPEPEGVARDDMILETLGPLIGQSRISEIERIIYVVPAVYSQLTMGQRYSVARLIGRLVHLTPHESAPTTLMMGPGRWGTSSPELGVPVSFSEINAVSALCEIVAMREDLVPDVSLGTHFFSELVEVDMLYLALFPNQEGHWLNTAFLEETPSSFLELLPDAGDFDHAIRVIELTDTPKLRLFADSVKQHALCYRVPADEVTAADTQQGTR